MEELLSKEGNELSGYDESIVRDYIQGIEIFDDHFKVRFKAGIEVEIKR